MIFKLLFLVSLMLLMCPPGTVATHPGAQDRAEVSLRTHRYRRRHVDDDAVVNVIARKVKKVGMAVNCSVGNCSDTTDNQAGPDRPFHSSSSITPIKSPAVFGVKPLAPRNVYSTGRPAMFSPPTSRSRLSRRRCKSRSMHSRQITKPVKQEKLAKRSLPTTLFKRQIRGRCCCGRCCCRRH